MENLEFKDKLEVLIEANPKLRPFVCDGYPLECEVFIVGINPATSTDSKFLDHWIGSKFDKEKWFESFEFLLKAIKPKALFLYGKEPRKYIEKKYEVDLRGSMPIEIEMEHGKVAVCAIKHVRLVKKEEIESSAKELISLIKIQLLLS